VDRDGVRVAALVAALAGVEGFGVSSAESSDDGVVSDGTEVCVVAVLAVVAAVRVALAASSLSETWGPDRTFVDAPSLKTATACHTTKLVTAVARTHDAAATPMMRRRDLVSMPQSWPTQEKGPVKEPRNPAVRAPTRPV
jgi:hypothetical protein